MPANGNPPVDTSAGAPRQGLPGARSALILLLAINLFNYIDRQILAAVLPKIEVEFLRDDPDPKTKLGLLTAAFLVAYMLFSPIFGWLGDRMSRWLLVAFGVILWSLASGGSGLATGFVVLLLTRCLVGVGEAAYGPAAPTLISDLYPVERRGSVLAWFYAAIPVGGALGYVLGGAVAGTALGWRGAFYLVVPPGILLGIICFFMREPRRGQADAGSTRPRKSAGLKDYLLLAKIPSYVLDTLGMTALTFAVGGIAAWMPTYLFEREAHFRLTPAVIRQLQEGDPALPASLADKLPASIADKLRPLLDRDFHPAKEFVNALGATLAPEEMRKYQERIIEATASPGLGFINLVFGGITVVSGLVATILGGIAGDRLRGRFPGSYFLVSGVSMLIAFPMLLLVVWMPMPLVWIFVFLAVFFLFFNTGPTNTILANVTHPSIRSTAFALNILMVHLLGDAISPVIMGVIADRASMDLAFVTVSVVVLVGAGFWLWGVRYLERDTALAPTRLRDS